MSLISFSLTDAMNTWNPALVVLEEKGYELGLDPPTDNDGNPVDDDDAGLGCWWAFKDGHRFSGHDPLALLAMTAIWEHRGDDWSRERDEDIFERILDETYPD